MRMGELEAHATADEMTLEHGASPSGPGDSDEDRLRAVLGMPGDQGGSVIDHDRGIEMMLGLDLKNGFGSEVFEEDAAFDLRLNDVAVDLIAEVEVRHERGQVGHGTVMLVTV